MKVIFFSITVFIFQFSFAQSCNDFILLTNKKDTLLTNTTNTLEIQTSYKLSKVSLIGKGVQIVYDKKQKKYQVTVIAENSKTVDIVLQYRKSKNETITFVYPFIVWKE
ncbi:MAG: hypothetical protein IPM74_02400 [Crocinitomicaceae bacterium]|nr:hypothetical protein [Crocinitomicaceae bacterium]MBK8924767.1 hypothetical protein [Crocinitomicaceae bacterium]